MTKQAPKPGERYLLTMCHSGDCCPQVYHHEEAPSDSCLRVVDDHGNEAFFGPLELLGASLTPLEGEQWVLRDEFGNEAYVSPAELATLQSDENLALVQGLIGI